MDTDEHEQCSATFGLDDLEWHCELEPDHAGLHRNEATDFCFVRVEWSDLGVTNPENLRDPERAYREVLRRAVRDQVDDPHLLEVIEAAAQEAREIRERHDQQLQTIQDEIDRRAATYGTAWEQVMRQAARLDDT